MKLIAYLLITCSVIFGSLASSTSYLVRLQGTSPEVLSTLRLGSPAGHYEPGAVDGAFTERLASARAVLDAESTAAVNPLKPEAPARTPIAVPEVESEPTGESVLRSREAVVPIGRTGDRLTSQLVELLNEAEVEYVKVTEFEFSRWPYAWLFAISCAGLLCGAWMIRRAGRSELESSNNADTVNESKATDAASVFSRLSGRLHSLGEELAATTDKSTRLEAILKHVGNIQREDVPAFAADRPALVSRLSLSGYAELMDNFAAMERQLNRAWSAAADSDLEESESCLQSAQPLLVETLRSLKNQQSSVSSSEPAG